MSKQFVELVVGNQDREFVELVVCACGTNNLLTYLFFFMSRTGIQLIQLIRGCSHA